MGREDLSALGVWELSSRLQILRNKLNGIDEYEQDLKDEIDRINKALARKAGGKHEEEKKI